MLSGNAGGGRGGMGQEQFHLGDEEDVQPRGTEEGRCLQQPQGEARLSPCPPLTPSSQPSISVTALGHCSPSRPFRGSCLESICAHQGTTPGPMLGLPGNAGKSAGPESGANIPQPGIPACRRGWRAESRALVGRSTGRSPGQLSSPHRRAGEGTSGVGGSQPRTHLPATHWMGAAR